MTSLASADRRHLATAYALVLAVVVGLVLAQLAVGIDARSEDYFAISSPLLTVVHWFTT